MASEYQTRSWAVARVCAPLGERAINDARTWLALELAVHVATPRQMALARGEVLWALARGAAAHRVTIHTSTVELAREVQVALGYGVDDITTVAISDALARHLPDEHLNTLFARRPTPRIPGWRAERVGR